MPCCVSRVHKVPKPPRRLRRLRWSGESKGYPHNSPRNHIYPLLRDFSKGIMVLHHPLRRVFSLLGWWWHWGDTHKIFGCSFKYQPKIMFPVWAVVSPMFCGSSSLRRWFNLICTCVSKLLLMCPTTLHWISYQTHHVSSILIIALLKIQDFLIGKVGNPHPSSSFVRFFRGGWWFP